MQVHLLLVVIKVHLQFFQQLHQQVVVVEEIDQAVLEDQVVVEEVLHLMELFQVEQEILLQ